MRRIAVFMAIGLLVSSLFVGLAAAPLLAQKQADSSAAPRRADAPASDSAATPPWIEELIELRRQFGASPLEGSLLEAGGDKSAGGAAAEFQNELHRLAKQGEPPTPDPKSR